MPWSRAERPNFVCTSLGETVILRILQQTLLYSEYIASIVERGAQTVAKRFGLHGCRRRRLRQPPLLHQLLS
jgi:hypothetical protein